MTQGWPLAVGAVSRRRGFRGDVRDLGRRAPTGSQLDDGGLRLQLVVQALAASRDLDEALAIVVNQALAGLGADTAIVGLISPDGHLEDRRQPRTRPVDAAGLRPDEPSVALPITDCVRSGSRCAHEPGRAQRALPALASHYETAPRRSRCHSSGAK